MRSRSGNFLEFQRTLQSRQPNLLALYHGADENLMKPVDPDILFLRSLALQQDYIAYADLNCFFEEPFKT